jgi:hypothetical protein
MRLQKKLNLMFTIPCHKLSVLPKHFAVAWGHCFTTRCFFPNMHVDSYQQLFGAQTECLLNKGHFAFLTLKPEGKELVDCPDQEWGNPKR